MAGASFAMDMKGLEKMVTRAIRHIEGSEELMAAIGEAFVSGTIERFEKGEDPEGNAWKPSKRAEAEGGQTLIDDGHLKGSIDYEASQAMVAVGTTNEVYGAIQHFGGAGVGKPEIEAREYIGISEEDQDEARAMVMAFMQAGFGQ